MLKDRNEREGREGEARWSGDGMRLVEKVGCNLMGQGARGKGAKKGTWNIEQNLERVSE